MRPLAGILWAVACGALVFAGLALGAESQVEEFLQPDIASQKAELERGAAGTLIPVTGVLAAAGVALGAAAVSRAPWKERLPGAAFLGAAAFLAIQFLQGAWPNYAAHEEGRSATLTINLFATDQPATPTLWVPVFAILLACVLAAGAGGRRLLGGPARAPADPGSLLGRFAGAAAVAVPFLAVTVWGCVRLLAGLSDAHAGLLAYLTLLPLAALAAAGFLVTLAWRLWALAAYVRNARLAGASEEAWRALGRADAALAGLLATVALLASFFPATDLDALRAGPTFGVTLRSHTQFLALALVALLPLAALHRDALAAFRGHRRHATLATGGAHPVALAVVAAAALSLLLAGVATFTAHGSLAPWLAALLPPAAVAFAVAPPRAAAPSALLAGATAWCIGNTVEATFGTAGNATLEFADGPGLLALWRLVGAVLAGLAVARLAARAAPPSRGSTAAPLAAGIAVLLSAIALIELPLSAWVVTRSAGESIGVGSLVASQEPPVRALLHTLAFTAATAAAFLVARLHRPEWFGRRPPAAEAAVRAKAPSAA